MRGAAGEGCDGGTVSAAGFEFSGGVRERAHASSGFSGARREDFCDFGVSGQEMGNGEADAGAAGGVCGGGAAGVRAGERWMGKRRGDKCTAAGGEEGELAPGDGGGLVQRGAEEAGAGV